MSEIISKTGRAPTESKLVRLAGAVQRRLARRPPTAPNSDLRSLDIVVDPETVPQFKTDFPFDYSSIRSKLETLAAPDERDPESLAKFNKDYLELYKQYDNSTWFREAVALETFDDRRKMPNFEILTEVYDDLCVPLLDQTNISNDFFLPHQKSWAKNGFLLIRGMVDKGTCDEYLDLRKKLNLGLAKFPTVIPYLDHECIMRMFCSPQMNGLIRDLIGEDLGLHFNLTPFTSTERGWHQDEYLNPPGIFGRYLAAWIAVDDVPEESGPFEFIAGSHKLPTVSRDKIKPYLKQQYCSDVTDKWTVHAEMFVNPAYFFKFVSDNSPTTKFLGRRGDVLLWHARLIHRGSPPARRSVRRPGIIGHFSPLRTTRWFGQDIRRYGDGGYYWHFEKPTPSA